MNNEKILRNLKYFKIPGEKGNNLQKEEEASKSLE